MKISYFVNGQPVTPTNHEQFEIEINFDRETSGAVLSTNRWQFDNKNAKPILQHLEDGLSGGVGVYEGPTFLIRIQKDNDILEIKKYLDTVNNVVWTPYSVEIDSQESAKVEWANTTFDSFRILYLYEETPYLGKSDDVAVPYVINSVPNYRDAIIVIISGVFIVDKLSDIVSQTTAEAARAAGVTSAIGVVLYIAIRVIYIIALLITLVQLVLDIIALIIQPVKYHKGMYVIDVINACCQYLGLTFESPFFGGTDWDDLLILPRKLNNFESEDDNRLLGFLSPKAEQSGVPEGTFGDMIRWLKDFFNAKVVMYNKKLKLVPLFHYEQGDPYIIPDVELCEYTTNADEILSNYSIFFQTDVNDKNTIKPYEGNEVLNQIAPINVINKDNRLLQNLREVGIPFALGREKTELTLPEKLVDGFLEIITPIVNALILAVNAVISVVNKVGKVIKVIKKVLRFFGLKTPGLKAPNIQPIQAVDWGEIIDDRLGMLMLENDYVSAPKLLLVKRGGDARSHKLKNGHREKLSAKRLWNDYHIEMSHVHSNDNPNQWLIYTTPKVPFCFEDYRKVERNNIIFDSKGRKAVIESIKWNPFEQLATIRFRVRHIYTKNLKETLHEPPKY